MKLVVRVFALTLVLAGGVAAVKSPAPSQAATSQMTASKLPIPICGPGTSGPTACPTNLR